MAKKLKKSINKKLFNLIEINEKNRKITSILNFLILKNLLKKTKYVNKKIS